MAAARRIPATAARSTAAGGAGAFGHAPGATAAGEPAAGLHRGPAEQGLEGQTTVREQRLVRPPEDVRGLVRAELANRSLYEVLAAEYRSQPQWAQQRIAAAVAGARTRSALGVPADAAVLFVERLTFDEANQPVEFVRTWMKSDVPLWTELRR